MRNPDAAQAASPLRLLDDDTFRTKRLRPLLPPILRRHGAGRLAFVFAASRRQQQ